MTIIKGLIWTYYDCSNTCYFLHKYDVNCIWMELSILLLAVVITMGIFWGGLWLASKIKEDLVE